MMHFHGTSLIDEYIAVPQRALAMPSLLTEANTHADAMLPRCFSDLVDLRTISVDALFHELGEESVS